MRSIYRVRGFGFVNVPSRAGRLRIVEDLNVVVPLAEAAAAGNRAALAELYELYGDTLYRVAYRLTESWSRAQDIVQQVFLGLPTALGSYAGRGSLEGWLVRLTTHTALTELRLDKRRNEVSYDSFQRTVGRARQDRVLERLAVEHALAKLTPDQRAMVTLKYIEGYTHEEISDILGISRVASRARLFRAVHTLRELLS